MVEHPGGPTVLLVSYPELQQAWHRGLWDSGIGMDFARPESDLRAYRMVLVPQLQLLGDTAIDSLVAYVRDGGTLVCGFFTGVADVDDRIRPGGMDGRLRELFGIRTVHEWWPLDAGATVACDGFRGTLWSEELEPDGSAETVAAYREGELDGLPAVLRKGGAWYVSTLPEPDSLRDLLGRAAAEAGCTPRAGGAAHRGRGGAARRAALPAEPRPGTGRGSTAGPATSTCSRGPRPMAVWSWTATT